MRAFTGTRAADLDELGSAGLSQSDVVAACFIAG
jgi:hypothetical protein